MKRSQQSPLSLSRITKCVEARGVAVIVSPALDAVVVQDRARMVITRCDGLCAAAYSQVDRVRRRRVAVCGVAVAELAVLVISPTLDAVVIQNCAGILIACCDGLGGSACSQVDRVDRGGTAVCGIAVAELAVIVGSPTLDAVVIQNRARMLIAGCDGLCAAACPQVEWVGIGSVAWVGVAITELVFVVVSPALDAVVIQDRASMVIARCDGLGGSAYSQVDRVRRRRVADCGVAIAELAVIVGSPTLDAVIVQQRASMN